MELVDSNCPRPQAAETVSYYLIMDSDQSYQTLKGEFKNFLYHRPKLFSVPNLLNTGATALVTVRGHPLRRARPFRPHQVSSHNHPFRLPAQHMVSPFVTAGPHLRPDRAQGSIAPPSGAAGPHLRTRQARGTPAPPSGAHARPHAPAGHRRPPPGALHLSSPGLPRPLRLTS